MKTKTCFKCNTEKPIVSFYKHKQMSDGHLNKCITCAKRDSLLNRRSNLEKVRAYDRDRANLPHRIKTRVEYTRKYREMFPEKYKANCKLNNAIRDGRIVRPNSCEMCGHECRPHAHHRSYEEDAWLDVEWLCAVCHGEAHAESHRRPD